MVFKGTSLVEITKVVSVVGKAERSQGYYSLEDAKMSELGR